MDDRWPYPISMTMQRQTGSAPKPRAVSSPSVAPAVDADKAAPDGKPETSQIPIVPEL